MPSVHVRGHGFHYEQAGHGPALLLIPGMFGTGRNDFGPQLGELSAEFCVIAPDPRGYGQSRPPIRDYPADFLERDAHDMAAIMSALGHTTYYAAGWSDGGNTALILAMNYPQAVAKLVVWGANSFVSDEDVQCFSKVRELSDWSQRARSALEAEYGEATHQLWAEYVAAQDKLFAAGGEICQRRLSEVQCPTLVLHGDKDPLVPEVHPQIIAAGIPNSALVRFPDGKHNFHLKSADHFNRIVRNFLAPPN